MERPGTKTEARRDDAGSASESRPRTAWERTGGLVGLLVSSLPSLVFVVVNSFAGLIPGIVASVASGVVFVVLAVVLKKPLQPAVSSFVGVAITSLIAFLTGSAKGYFLSDIWFSLACFVVLAVSIIVRRPLVGVVWSLVNSEKMTWLADRRSRLGYDLATATATLVFASRFLVQQYLYDQDRTGWLAFAKIAMGNPLTGLAFGAAAWAIHYASKREKLLADA
ncbi:DUF3159 domain-containing protein [Amycolatopsis sp. CA-161197]|uniref:DUF3159 domain-containing protein n=1 Tax=unclassified Amycolatopsis TaxID=2618356 RepID=UPI0034525D4A